MYYLLFDIRSYTRTPLPLGLSVAFSCSVLLLLSLGLANERPLLEALAPHFVWITFFLASMFSFERVIQPDLEDGTLNWLAGSRLSLPTICLTKAISHWLCTQLPLVLCVPFFSFLLNIGPVSGLMLTGTLLMGTWAFSFWGLFCACLTVRVARSSMLSTLLIVPLVLPTLILGPHAQEDARILAVLGALSFLSALVTPLVGGLLLQATLSESPSL